MGYGNYLYGSQLHGGKGTFLSAPSAVRLLSHPVFAGSDKDRLRQPKVALEDIQFLPTKNRLTVQGVVTSDVPIYAVLVRVDDLSNRGDYDARSFFACPDEQGRFSVAVPLESRRNYRMEIVFLCVNHRDPTTALEVAVEADGTVKLDSLARMTMLMRYRGKHRPATGIEAWAREPAGTGPFPSPDKVPASVKRVSLADLQWQEASTGYGPAQRNGVPNETGWPLLTSHDRGPPQRLLRPRAIRVRLRPGRPLDTADGVVRPAARARRLGAVPRRGRRQGAVRQRRRRGLRRTRVRRRRDRGQAARTRL